MNLINFNNKWKKVIQNIKKINNAKVNYSKKYKIYNSKIKSNQQLYQIITN